MKNDDVDAECTWSVKVALERSVVLDRVKI